MASKGQIDYEEYPWSITTQKRVNRSDDSPFLSEDHIRGFQEHNCNQCILGVHYRLFIQAAGALAQRDDEKFKAIIHRPVECFTDEWIVSNRVGYYPLIQSTCEGFSMSRFPVSDCSMKMHMQEE